MGVSGYPACDFSSDGTYFDLYKPIGMPLMFNVAMEYGMDISMPSDGVYSGASSHADGKRFIPMYNVQMFGVGGSLQEYLAIIDLLLSLFYYFPWTNSFKTPIYTLGFPTGAGILLYTLSRRVRGMTN